MGYKMVVVRKTKNLGVGREEILHRSEHRFDTEDHVQDFIRRVGIRYPYLETHIVDIKHATAPDGEKPRGMLWCSYCSDYRKYKKDLYLGRTICPICQISTNDFYIKTHNNLWKG